MYLLSIGIEYRKKLKRRLKSNNISNDRIRIFTEDDIDDKEEFKEYEYVICEYNKKIINYFLKLGKKIILLVEPRNKIADNYLNNKRIAICYSIDEVIGKTITEQIREKKDIYKERDFKKILEFSKIIGAGLVLIIAIIGVFHITSTLKKDSKKIEKSTKIVEKEEQVKVKTPDYKKENYLFLGDSITNYYNLENYYGDLPVVNSGIGWNKTTDILDDMYNRVYKYNPTKVFLLIGTNDIAQTDITNEELIDNIIEICDKIHENRKKADIYIESIYPVDNSVIDNRPNSRIKEINKMLKERIKGTKYHYLDLFNLLADDKDNIKEEYTKDGLHISDDGYQIITKEIKEIIEKA